MTRSRLPRDEAEYAAAFQDQLSLLHDAGEVFDSGSLAQAQNLSIRIRVLVHDEGQGQSFLKQIGAKDRLPYLETALAESPPGVISLDSGLCMIEGVLGPDGSNRFKAPLDNLDVTRQHPPAAFVDWWNDNVLTDQGGTSFSRKDLVLAMAETDGGAHFDATLDAAYKALTRDRSTQLVPGPAGEERFKNIAPPTIRQIAYELERTLSEEIVEDPGARFGLRVRNPICSLSIHEPVDVGRNDLCRCASGLKRKKCFDLRQPRRRPRLEELGAVG